MTGGNTNERQLAELLIGIGMERGVEIDHIAHELSSQQFPAFVDESEFKSSLLDAVETQLRRQTDERIERLRNQLVGAATQVGRVQLERKPSEPTEERQEVVEPDPPGDIEETNQTVVVDEDLPEDATMVWHTADDRKDS